MAPVAGSAYTYAYATLGELLAWIIGWDLVLEYAMACACVAAAWSKYLNKFTLRICFLADPRVPVQRPVQHVRGPGSNLPAVLITVAVTAILVIGIRESTFPTPCWSASRSASSSSSSPSAPSSSTRPTGRTFRRGGDGCRQEAEISAATEAYVKDSERLSGEAATERAKALEVAALPSRRSATAARHPRQARPRGPADTESRGGSTPSTSKYASRLPQTVADREAVEKILAVAADKAKGKEVENWGLLGAIGLNE